VVSRGNDLRLTQDVDVASALPAPVVAAAAEVAARHRMNRAWLNEQVREMIELKIPIERFLEVYRGRHLIVYGADDELLLALKLMAGRPQDIPDIVDLAKRTGSVTEEDLMGVWDETYRLTPGVSAQRHFVLSVVREDVLPQLVHFHRIHTPRRPS